MSFAMSTSDFITKKNVSFFETTWQFTRHLISHTVYEENHSSLLHSVGIGALSLEDAILDCSALLIRDCYLFRQSFSISTVA